MPYKSYLTILALTAVVCSAQFDYSKRGDIGFTLFGHRATVDVAEALKGDVAQGSLGLGVETPYGPKANTRLGGSSGSDRLLGGISADVQATDELGVNSRVGGGVLKGRPELKIESNTRNAS